jgi:hypothetical protein
MERMGLLPLDLLLLPVWRGLTGLPRSHRAPMRLAMVQAWDRRHQAPLHWAKVQRQAKHLAEQKPPGTRQADKVMPWLENV